MKYTSLLLALGLCLNASAALNVPHVAEAKAQAAREGKPALIIWHGSDWMQNADALQQKWQKLASDRRFVLGQYDDIAADVPGKPERSKVLGLEIYNLPVGVLLAKDGSFMACYDAATMTAPGNGPLQAEVQQMLQKHGRFCELADLARSSSGVEAARAAGRALSLLKVEDAMRQRELCGIINSQDPQDETGYRSLFVLEHMGMYKEIHARLKGGAEGRLEGAARDFDGAEAYLRNTIDKGLLFGERLQQWLAGLAFVQRERMLSTQSTDRTALLETFARIVAINPESQCGIGAQTLYNYWNPDHVYTIDDYHFDGQDLCIHGEKDWRINITSELKGQGRYTIHLQQIDGGNLDTRHYRLLINGKVVQTAPNPEHSVKTVQFNIPAVAPDDKVEVQLTTRYYEGWYSGSGHVIVTKENQ